MKKTLLLRAPVLTKSGYGVHSRQILRYLLDYSVQVQLPNEWDASLARKNIGVTAGVETTAANPTWASVHCSKMDLIIVPSQHTKDSLLSNSFTNTPVKVVPETYFDEICLEPEDLDLGMKTAFNFLAVGVMTGTTPETDRKNLFYLIKWFVEEFKDDPDVGLVIKTNRGRETAIDRAVTFKVLKQVLRECRTGKFPNVYLVHGVMSRKDMTSMYKSKNIKALISCTRGEGFGLPMIEAAAAGLPVIATDWSAHKEFLDLGKWINVDYELKQIPDQKVDNNIFVNGSQWAEVKEEDFKKKIRKFYKGSQLPTEWAEDLSEKIQEKYCWKNIMQYYDEALSGIIF